MTAQPLPSPVLSPGRDAVDRAERRIRRALSDARAPAVTCSMQLGGIVLLDLLRRHTPSIPVIFVDTGYHFADTIAFRDELAEVWGLNMVVVSPATSVPAHEASLGILYESEPSRCCFLRKVAPADAALEGHDVWFAALRRQQTVSRRRLEPVEVQRLSSGAPITKVSPLLDWTWADVDRYATHRRLPRHPLYASGFTSIGCAPCTQPTFRSGEDRSGRWAESSKTECGLHMIRGDALGGGGEDS